MDRVERPQCRPTDLRSSRHYRLDRKPSQPGEYPDRDGRSLSARRRAVRVTSTVASKLEARSGQRCSSWRSAAVSASIAISSTRAEESRYATGVLLATLTHVARLRAAFNLECRRGRRVRA
jgi:hypothetical protein